MSVRASCNAFPRVIVSITFGAARRPSTWSGTYSVGVEGICPCGCRTVEDTFSIQSVTLHRWSGTCLLAFSVSLIVSIPCGSSCTCSYTKTWDRIAKLLGASSVVFGAFWDADFQVSLLETGRARRVAYPWEISEGVSILICVSAGDLAESRSIICISIIWASSDIDAMMSDSVSKETVGNRFTSQSASSDYIRSNGYGLFVWRLITVSETHVSRNVCITVDRASVRAWEWCCCIISV